MNSQHDSTGLSRSTANHSQTIQKEREREVGERERGKNKVGKQKEEHSRLLQSQSDYNTNVRRRTQQRKYRPISLMNTDPKILHQVLASRIQTDIKIIHHVKDGFISKLWG